MSFLNQLKTQAQTLQSEQGQRHVERDQGIAQTEAACRIALHYLNELARQLNVIEPPAPRFSLDGKKHWPAMKLTSFRVDARKKVFANREVFDYLAMGWSVVPQAGGPISGMVSVNFPPDLERVESRLAMGLVQHDRKDVRHPEKNTLQAICFEYVAETRGSVTITADHDHSTLAFRLLNLSGFGVANASWPAASIRTDTLDELAKLIVSEPSRFV